MRQLKITKQITNRETASLDKYLQEIGKEGLITAEEEVDLARRIKEGDEVALNKMVKANLRFVVSVSKQYQNQGLSLPDLINEGNLGLIKAARRFDETRGFKFISYAVWWIRQSILQALADQARIVRLPLNKIGNINKINRKFAELEQIFEREPSADEISSDLDISQSEVEKNMKNEHNMRPFHKEGLENSHWVLLDYADVIVHIFQEPFRRFYKLEDLWADGIKRKIQ
jgi:RNA polymerase primary sigma factor